MAKHSFYKRRFKSEEQHEIFSLGQMTSIFRGITTFHERTYAQDIPSPDPRSSSQIFAFKKSEKSQAWIARELGVSPSTISQELRRNIGRLGYNPDIAAGNACGSFSVPYKDDASTH